MTHIAPKHDLCPYIVAYITDSVHQFYYGTAILQLQSICKFLKKTKLKIMGSAYHA